jgi:hypothetical protein
MKLHAAQRLGRNFAAENWEWTRDNRVELPRFVKERPPEGLPSPAPAA